MSWNVSLKRNRSRGFGAMHVRVNKNWPFANTIKNNTLVVFSELFLKVGYSGQISVFLTADMLTRTTNTRMAVLGNRLRLCCVKTH